MDLKPTKFHSTLKLFQNKDYNGKWWNSDIDSENQLCVLTRSRWYNEEPLTWSQRQYVWTQTFDSRLWEDQQESIRSPWQDHIHYTCRIWQLTVVPEKNRAIAYEASDKISATICANPNCWLWALTRLGWWCEKPLLGSERLYMWIITANNGL